MTLPCYSLKIDIIETLLRKNEPKVTFWFVFLSLKQGHCLQEQGLEW